MDIFKMANQIANNMTAEDKESIENMDMEKMISHVTKNLFKMMNNQQEETGNVEEDESEADSENIPKTRDICFDLNVDLEDFYTGKKKKLNVKRKVILDGKVIEEKKKLVIPIEKGMKDEQQIKFEEEADQIPGYKQGDIVINLIENEHPFFQRDGDNLIIIKNVNLYEIYDLTFDIKHLDGRILRINKDPSDALHLNESLRKIPGEGMPKYKIPGEFGDLFIRFNIVIPKSLDPEKLVSLKTIFDDTLDPDYVEYENVDKTCILENASETDIEDLESESDYTDSDDSEESELSASESETESEPEVVLKRKKKM